MRSVTDAHHDALHKSARVNEYKVMRVLGRGGFGITYLAFDLNLNGAVALKEYFPAGYARRMADSSVGPVSPESRAVFDWGLKSFLAEAQAIHRLDHPNVVRARRYFEKSGSAFIVMDYVEGDSLEEILKQRSKLTFAEWQPLLGQLLDGLEHIHDHDYLHRDLKPANIVVRDADGAPVLIDFGSARIAAGERTNTQVYTDGYAPIEQYGSRKQKPPADLYALGAVSYRALLGKTPPNAPNRVIRDTIARLSERVSGAEPGWLAALDRCLALQPKDRPQSVAGLRKEFGKPSASANNPAVEKYRMRFERPKSGRGMALMAPLSPPFSDWAVRRWVGRRTSGAFSAAAFAPFHRTRGTDAGDKPLFQKRVDSEADGFAWLFELEENGAIEEIARGRIESAAGPWTEAEPPVRPSPRPRQPRVGTAVGSKPHRKGPRISIDGIPLPEWERRQQAKREREAEERAQATGKAVLVLWYGSPVAAAMCDSGGGDSMWLVGVAGLVIAVITCAAAFEISRQKGILMLSTLGGLLGVGVLAFQQEWVWALMALYFLGGVGLWWVAARLCRAPRPSEDGSAA